LACHRNSTTAILVTHPCNRLSLCSDWMALCNPDDAESIGMLQHTLVQPHLSLDVVLHHETIVVPIATNGARARPFAPGFDSNYESRCIEWCGVEEGSADYPKSKQPIRTQKHCYGPFQERRKEIGNIAIERQSRRYRTGPTLALVSQSPRRSESQVACQIPSRTVNHSKQTKRSRSEIGTWHTQT
jgi:hypothetical protein